MMSPEAERAHNRLSISTQRVTEVDTPDTGRPDIPLEAGYTRIIANKSGVVDVMPWQDGIWMVVEDTTDCCSVSLSAREIGELISRFSERLQMASDRPQTALTGRERVTLEYLSHLMEANAQMVGERLREVCPGSASNTTALGAAVCGRLKRRGLVLRISELNAWRISRAGRDALNV